MNAILLSAGFGTRFRPYTNHFAKAAIPFFNIPSIAYSLYYCNQFNIKNVVINTHHLPNSIENAVRKLNLKSPQPTLSFLNEFPQILDSGGGMKNAEHILGQNDHFLSFNTDIPHILPNLDFDKLLEFHKSKNSLVTFVTTDKPGVGTKFGGVWTEPNESKILDFGRKNETTQRGRHYCGIIIASNKLFQYQEKEKPLNIIYDVALPLLKEGKEDFHCFHIDDHISFETGNLKDYLESHFFCFDKMLENPNMPFAMELKKIVEFYGYSIKTMETKKAKILYFSDNPPQNTELFYNKNILGKDWALPSEETEQVENSVLYGNSYTSNTTHKNLLSSLYL